MLIPIAEELLGTSVFWTKCNWSNDDWFGWYIQQI
jgi:hypothetical protein